MDIGVDLLKIEGCMKLIYYIVIVVLVYCKVIDVYVVDFDNFKINLEWLIELDKCVNRDIVLVFFEGIFGYEE